MKLTPFALRNLSSRGVSPSRILGELSVSSGVKYHWFARGLGALIGDGCAGEGAGPGLDCGGSEDVREECVGGVGTAGGMRADGEFDGRAERTGFGGRVVGG